VIARTSRASAAHLCLRTYALTEGVNRTTIQTSIDLLGLNLSYDGVHV